MRLDLDVTHYWFTDYSKHRSKRMAETMSRLRRATTIYANNAVTTTELNLDISDEYVKLSSL